jgi:hypothetical protein
MFTDVSRNYFLYFQGKNQTIQRNIAEDSNILNHYCENLKSNDINIIYDIT